jgi:hypothetical protein
MSESRQINIIYFCLSELGRNHFEKNNFVKALVEAEYIEY